MRFTVRKVILVATVVRRAEMFHTFLRSVRQFLPRWELVVVAQEFSDGDEAIIRALAPAATIIRLPQRIGPHMAKMKGLRHILATPGEVVICNADDDIEFLPQTNLAPCVSRVLDPTVGFVSAGWVAREAWLAKRTPVEAWVRQPIVYTGGGMLMARKTAELVAALPNVDYLDDNTEWSLAAYLAGYENFRYRGSLAIHRIGSGNGLIEWANEGVRKIPDTRYLRLKPGNPNRLNKYLIGSSEDLTEEAKALHRKRAAELRAKL